MKLLVAGIVASGATWAQGHESTSGAAPKTPALEWFSAGAPQIRQASCVLATELSTEEIERALAELAKGGKRVTGSVNGVSFRDESSVLTDAFGRLTTPSNNGVGVSYQLRDPQCADVICALSEMVGGREIALRQLYLSAQFGYNVSPIVPIASSYGGSPMTSAFNAEELDDLIRGLMDFPGAALPPTGGNRPLKRYKPGYTQGNYADKKNGVAANSYMIFFDPWAKYERPLRRGTLTHEIAHNIGQAKGLDLSADWLALSGWKRLQGDKWESSRPDFVSEYGGTDPKEDFAESVVAYRYQPQLLRRVSPAKYNFLKDKVFGGAEFGPDANCEKVMSPAWNSLRAQQAERGEREQALCRDALGEAGDRLRRDPDLSSRIGQGRMLAACRESVLGSLAKDQTVHAKLSPDATRCLAERLLRDELERTDEGKRLWRSCERHAAGLIATMPSLEELLTQTDEAARRRYRTAFRAAALSFLTNSAPALPGGTRNAWFFIQNQLVPQVSGRKADWPYYEAYYRDEACRFLTYDLIVRPNALLEEFRREGDVAYAPLLALDKNYEAPLRSLCTNYVGLFRERYLKSQDSIRATSEALDQALGAFIPSR